MRRRDLASSLVLLASTGLLLGCPEGSDIEAEKAAAARAAELALHPPSPDAAYDAAKAPDLGPDPTRPKAPASLLDPCVEPMPGGRFGGSLSFGAYDDPKTFNPTLAHDSVSARFITYFFDALAEEDGITYEVEPILAKSWTLSPDGKQYTFHLRRGVTWQDGKPLTAKDVAFTWNEVLANPDVPWDTRDTVKVEGVLPKVEALDEHTVRFTLPKAFAPFLRTAATSVPVLPEHVFGPWVRTKGADGKPISNTKWGVDSDPRSIVGSGAWMVESYKPGERLTLKRNPNYFRVTKHGQALPYLDRMDVPFLKNLETAVLKFQAGETDAQWFPGKSFAVMRPLEKSMGFHLVDGGPDFRTSYMVFNLNPGKGKDGKPLVNPVRLKWFQDKRFRQAVAYAMDREAVIKNVYRGLATEQNSPIFQKSPYFAEGLPSYPHNPAKAAALLAEAGFVKRGDKLFDAQGNEVIFEVLKDVGSAEADLELNLFKGDLSKLGITVKVVPVTFNVKIARTHESKDWECMAGAWGAGIEPHGVSHLWMSHGQAHTFNLNPSETRHAQTTYPWEKEIDDLFEQGAATVDEAKRKDIYRRFQQVVMEEAVMMFRPVFSYTVGVRNRVGNARPSPYSSLGSTWNSWELYKKP